MSVPYDKYYQTKNLFGEPYPELIDYFSAYPKKSTLLDVGCGQGRDAIALAKLGYQVTGIDSSKVGIEQMNRVAKAEGLQLAGQVADIYSFDNYDAFDVILFDSMFHFSKKDKEKEVNLLKKVFSTIKPGSIVVVRIQDTGKKVEVLQQTVQAEKQMHFLENKQFKYTFEDRESGHTSITDYRMLVVEK